jgi:hypothetical protein
MVLARPGRTGISASRGTHRQRVKEGDGEWNSTEYGGVCLVSTRPGLGSRKGVTDTQEDWTCIQTDDDHKELICDGSQSRTAHSETLIGSQWSLINI